MGSQFGAFVEFESSPIANPAAAVRKDKQGIASATADHELAELHLGRSYTEEDQGISSLGPSEVRTPTSPLPDVESLPQSPGVPRRESNTQPAPASVTAELVQSLSIPPKNKWRFLSACVMFLANGMSDSSPGALIPYMEKDYQIGYAIVSLIFVANAMGFILAAPLTDAMNRRFGRSKTSMFCQALLVVGYAIIVCKVPFPTVVVSYFLIGLGVAINLSLNNVFLVNLVHGTEILGVAHGSYGIGGTVAPLIATVLVSHGVHWTYFYFILLGLATFNLFYSGWAFHGYEKELPVQLLTALQRTASREHEAPLAAKKSMLRRAIKSKVTLLGALFIFAYQGAEVSISGWIVSYLINYRDGNPAQVGYVSSGFWAGITLGRFILTYPARRIGEKLAVLILTAGAIAFQLLAWFIPNIIGQAVAVAIIGLILGPVYPCAAVVFSRLLPRHIQTTSLSFISAMGSSGGAIAPFITGLLAQHVGTVVLHPVCLGLYGVMVVSWSCLPRIVKRSE